MKPLLSAILIALCLSFVPTKAQTTEPLFKVIAFYSASWDGGHISYAHEANVWFPEMAKKYNFVYDSTNNWNNLNESYLAQYQVVLFLDNQPASAQYAAFEKYMKNGGSWMGFHVVAFNQDPTAWDWYYNKFLGMGSYKNNTWAPTSAVLKVEDRTHPATVNLPDTFTTAPNEWYGWMVDIRKKANIKVLCSIDPASYPLGTGTGSGGASEIWTSGDHPVVWTNTDYHMMYVNMGHNLVDYGKNNKTLSWTFKNETQNKLIIDGLFWLASLNKPNPRATKLSITSPLNGASFKDPATIEINVNATDSDGIAKVEFYNGATKLGEDLNAPFSFTWENVGRGAYDITVKVTDSINNVISTSVSVDVQGEGPYNGVKATIPGKIEVENFDFGGQGVGYSDADVSNQGGQYRTAEGVDIEACTDVDAGYNIGYGAAAEWLKYSVNVQSAGYYTLQARLASPNSGKYFHVEMDGVDVSGKIGVVNTKSWTIWKTVNVAIPNITAGEKSMKIVFDTDGFNINYINFTHDTIVSVKALSENSHLVYPNPTDGMVNIRLKDVVKVNTTLLVADISGKLMKSVSYNELKGKSIINLDLSDLKKGQYFLQFSNEKTASSVVLN